MHQRQACGQDLLLGGKIVQLDQTGGRRTGLIRE